MRGGQVAHSPGGGLDVDTLRVVGKAISVRLDEEAQRALSRLEASGMNRSEAIRRALVESAQRLRRRQQIVAECTALEADETDRREMSEVASLMERLHT